MKENVYFKNVMDTSMVVYSPANDTTIIGLSMTLCITMCMWMICTVLRTQYEIDTMKERFSRITAQNCIEELEVKIDSQQEQIHDLHQKLDTYKESMVKIADVERQCDIYRTYAYQVIDLKEKTETITKQLATLQAWVDLYRKNRGI